MAVCSLAFAGFAGLGVAGLRFEGASVSIVAFTLGFGAMCVYSGWTAAAMAWMRIDVGYDWVGKRTLRGSRRVSFSEIVGFSEVRGLIRYGAHGSEFRLFTADAPPLTFSTQVAGWAAIVEALHESIPWRVPPAAALYARRGRAEGLVDPYSALFTAPGQPIPEERASPLRIRWLEFVLVTVTAMLAVIPLGVAATLALHGVFGRRTWLDFGVTALAIVAIQLATVLIARWLRDRRITRARRRAP